MRIHVVYDKSGAIIGGSVAANEPSGRGPRSGPQAGHGGHAAEFEVPSEFAALALQDVAERLRVDVTGKDHKLVKRA